ncbi:hypothetical protein PHIM7_236 [Sinorhizobium phage phiM7]|uniref:Uncharacterized protein n=3 Tax=Emdodecavirus TaxID=1980937 RepID=S5MVM4_9CAUD|nr:hypothetical protein AB690_gp271 [Sinorhizobium phage phiM12]YP_009212487.1 hypothetical protein AVT40_gp286 [Sinorhizobium phage phiN3]YP_009601361.1 hypothetical protein FDH46_gp242 [Sinorhizobium phage phiM7]AKF13142.1 hypothetical protein PHIM19_237 [Sinorhizobium phage phiM19]AGR47947.2 hypothetical protein SmphiM12_315 [Sinorhizobium phage phiM12]AKF12781.1 hypothetical protein PHIM7_236 [Sinorhizobium phage phiM7]AKF13510.1 hypothetical protein PHIN3_247 [Sinorhizobium phage phiN3]
MDTLEVKIWETQPMGFASFRDKLMAFCYENNCAPDDVLIAPYVEMEFDEIAYTGIRLTIKKAE